MTSPVAIRVFLVLGVGAFVCAAAAGCAATDERGASAQVIEQDQVAVDPAPIGTVETEPVVIAILEPVFEPISPASSASADLLPRVDMSSLRAGPIPVPGDGDAAFADWRPPWFEKGARRDGALVVTCVGSEAREMHVAMAAARAEALMELSAFDGAASDRVHEYYEFLVMPDGLVRAFLRRECRGI